MSRSRFYGREWDEVAGLDPDNVLVGEISDGHQGKEIEKAFSDQKLCSERCFWFKENRGHLHQHWSSDDRNVLNTLRAAYEDEERMPCLLFMTGLIGSKTCVEVF